jgi:hypothetical protein
MPEENNNLSTLIKKYFTTEHITIATFLIYGWGFLYNYLYYNSFGINIIKYISLQETLIDTIIFITIISVFSLIFTIATYYISFGIALIRKKNRVRKYVSIKRRNFYYYLNFSWIWVSVIMIVYFMTGLIISIIMKIDTAIIFKYLGPVSFINLFIATFLVYSKLKISLFKYFTYFFVIIFLLMLIHQTAIYQTRIVLRNKTSKKEIINLSSGITYTTNDSILYIGETSSTIFLFNKSLNNTIIINKANVVQTQLINQATIKIKKGATD